MLVIFITSALWQLTREKQTIVQIVQWKLFTEKSCWETLNGRLQGTELRL